MSTIITHAVEMMCEAASFQHSRATEKKSYGAFKAVVPCVSDHSRSQTFSKNCECSEERAINSDQQHASRTFVAVRETEDSSRNQHADPNVPQQCGELMLQISAKDDLLAKAG